MGIDDPIKMKQDLNRLSDKFQDLHKQTAADRKKIRNVQYLVFIAFGVVLLCIDAALHVPTAVIIVVGVFTLLVAFLALFGGGEL